MFHLRIFERNQQFQAIHGDICATILNFGDETISANGTCVKFTRSSLDGSFHGGFSKCLVNRKRPTPLEFEFHLQFPCGSPSTDLSDFRHSAQSGNDRVYKQTRAKGNDIITKCHLRQ